MESSGKNLWVGITDRETEGVFKYLNGQTVNARVNQDENLLYYFETEPDGERRENCVHLLKPFNKNMPHYVLNDAPCNYVTTALGGDWHGLCEIKNPTF